MHQRALLVPVLLAVLCQSMAIAEPDEEALGKSAGYPRGTPGTMYEERFKVGSFSGTALFLRTSVVAHGGAVTSLPHVAAPPPVGYRYKGEHLTLDCYLERRRATGLLVLKNGEIVAEHYRYGRGEWNRFLSFSMAKSVTSMLIGIALDRGFIKSLDDPAENYVAELKGSGYGHATVRQLLRMSSGIKFVEEYNGKDDMARLNRSQHGVIPDRPLAVLKSFNERAFPAGEKLAYSSAENAVLGYVLARAVGKDVTTLTRAWLWQPLGAESDAGWNVGVDGQEITLGSFNATLRDYGRLGLLLAHDGEVNNRQVVPRGYLLDATTAASQPAAFRPHKATNYFGYGYQFWIFPLRDRTFAMLGIYGQCIFVQPDTGIVMVQTAVTRDPIDNEASIERDALWRGVLESLGGRLEP